MVEDVTIWPDAVNDATAAIIEVIHDMLEPEEVEESLLRDELSKAFLEKFLSGETLLLTEEEFGKAYALASVVTTLQRLASKGLIQSVEDENGEPVYWLTEEGKEQAKQYRDLESE